jgi:hypothetical protein
MADDGAAEGAVVADLFEVEDEGAPGVEEDSSDVEATGNAEDEAPASSSSGMSLAAASVR